MGEIFQARLTEIDKPPYMQVVQFLVWAPTLKAKENYVHALLYPR